MASRATPKQAIGLRLQPRYILALRAVAERKGLAYHALIQMWLVERLWEEAPHLMGPDRTRPREPGRGRRSGARV